MGFIGFMMHLIFMGCINADEDIFASIYGFRMVYLWCIYGAFMDNIGYIRCICGVMYWCSL